MYEWFEYWIDYQGVVGGRLVVVRVEDQICVGLEIDEGVVVFFLDFSVLDWEVVVVWGFWIKVLYSIVMLVLIKISNEGKWRCKSKIINLMGGDDMIFYFFEFWMFGCCVCWWWECYF